MPRPRVPRSGGEPPCVELSAREANYLLALRQLAAEGVAPTQVALARMMGVSGSTAHEMVNRLRRLELLEPRGLALTMKGTSAALVLASRHHAAELLTREVLALDERDSTPAAAWLAPSLSPELTRRLIAGRRPRS